jgi:hypothetical protein
MVIVHHVQQGGRGYFMREVVEACSACVRVYVP